MDELVLARDGTHAGRLAASVKMAGKRPEHETGNQGLDSDGQELIQPESEIRRQLPGFVRRCPATCGGCSSDERDEPGEMQPTQSVTEAGHSPAAAKTMKALE